jgi:hypothetical protein
MLRHRIGITAAVWRVARRRSHGAMRDRARIVRARISIREFFDFFHRFVLDTADMTFRIYIWYEDGQLTAIPSEARP